MILTSVQSILDRNIGYDVALRVGIRHLLSRRLSEEQQKEIAAGDTYKTDFVEMLKASPIALSTRTANEQHYEVPDDFFKLVLGRHLKYSSGYWVSGCQSLEDAERAMLALTCERAAIQDGESVLELGCGWGSLTLFMAQTFSNSAITAVSNSSTQKNHIEQQAAARGLTNITVITSDMNDFQVEQQFDRVVSVEMFEHMRNYQELLARISGWIKPGGTLFVHIFSHRYFAYTFDVDGSGQLPARGGVDLVVQVGHGAVFPDEGVKVPAGDVGGPDDLIVVVDTQCPTGVAAGQDSEIGHASIPKEGMRIPPRGVGHSDHIPRGVDRLGPMNRRIGFPSERT